MVLTFKKVIINCNLDEKMCSLLSRNFASSNCCLLSFLCGGYLIKEILMEVHPPLSDGGGSTSFTDLR